MKATQLYSSRIGSICLVTFALLFTMETRAGVPDPTFGNNGVAQHLTSYEWHSSEELGDISCCVIALQPDGKILIAGATNVSSPRLVLRRFSADGSIDLTFGFGGEAVEQHPSVLPISFLYGVPLDMKVQSDGKIIVTGYLKAAGADDQFAVWRFMPGGYLDTTFGGDGFVTRFAGEEVRGRSLAVRQNGYMHVLTSNRKIACITPTGAVCPGRATTISLPAGNFYKLALQSETQLVVVGASVARRYNITGIRDMTFGSQGEISFYSCFAPFFASSLEMLPNGGFYVAGGGCNPGTSNCYFKLARFTSNGTPDSTYGGGDGCLGDGSPHYLGFQGIFSRMRVQPDQKLVVLSVPATYIYPNFQQCELGSPCGSHRRFNADGTDAASFNLTTPFPLDQDFLIQPDGKFVTLGTNFSGPVSSIWIRDIYLGRYLAQ